MRITTTLLSILVILCANPLWSQEPLTLRQALATAVANYPSIRAKAAYINASQATAIQTRKEALPNFILSAQQDYGTVNGQNGPLYGFGGLGVASSGLPLANQNWNAAFGALYLANVNWDVFTFGKVRERNKAADEAVSRDRKDLDQEIFQHQVRVTSAYLNLLAAQRLARSQQFNLSRADTLRFVVIARAKGGLIAGVDSSQANADVSNARTALIAANDAEQERAAQLALLMGVANTGFSLDTIFLGSIPQVFADTANIIHPVLDWYKSRIAVSDQQARYIRRLKYPSVSVFGVIQTRASGFRSNYATDQTAFNHDYFEGIKPTRSNYLLGVGISWNLTSLLRVKYQAAAQQAVSTALREEYNQAELQLKTQQALAETKIANAIASYNEAPVQVRSASDAYLQRSVLYRNGLTNIVDLTQTLYSLNRAEINRDIAYANIWQALLLKAAALGDFGFFISQVSN